MEESHLSDGSGLTSGATDDVSWVAHAWRVSDKMKSGCQVAACTDRSTDHLFKSVNTWLQPFRASRCVKRSTVNVAGLPCALRPAFSYSDNTCFTFPGRQAKKARLRN
ncbi:hypothetical protein SCLCIDRAFT_1222479 [Scleroderma citrinum Foug A]|uniref:Uncharacterized protein n=1 Tax=Scleroderma citrinum Foug A TaxID=1036808 RepID=A0A0C3CZ55_9AGAM|nr:hypothetical protein SCLCIDRAFT_1222479 [Scleroderma citrinum Foug A]